MSIFLYDSFYAREPGVEHTLRICRIHFEFDWFAVVSGSNQIIIFPFAVTKSLRMYAQQKKMCLLFMFICVIVECKPLNMRQPAAKRINEMKKTKKKNWEQNTCFTNEMR